jgi:CDP-diacylglycerol---glycerol-3-phosphate 3-phosphatidyltransferase
MADPQDGTPSPPAVEPAAAAARASLLNTANAITVVRMLLIPVFLVLLLSHLPYGAWLAIAVFAVAAFTDKLDGYVARSRGQITKLGQFLDPLADKMLISAALIALVGLHKLPAWVAMVIIAREFAVSALRVVGIDQGVSIPASSLGKAKTISQIVAVIILMWPHGHLWYAPLVENTAIYVAVGLTVISGIQYFLRARDLLRPPGGQA